MRERRNPEKHGWVKKEPVREEQKVPNWASYGEESMLDIT